ncbi:MAG: pyridoxamine 5'-phosphate oxidase [Actinomycetota bacterium]|nr:pyridoxamine 5'-phosphate oxidase [Actinomycetota bacterium]
MSEPIDLPHVRVELMTAGLSEADAPADPFELFQDWLGQAVDLGIHNANAMAVATAGAGGRPSVRNVLLRSQFEDGLAFYTNYESHKGVDLAANPSAEALFSWLGLERQVRFSGPVTRTTAERSDAYFATRERESRISAIASEQSRPVVDRPALERRHAEVDASFGDADPVRPAHWGGYLLVPDRIEFWQGREHRLHDRLLYELDDGHWSMIRLAP